MAGGITGCAGSTSSSSTGSSGGGDFAAASRWRKNCSLPAQWKCLRSKMSTKGSKKLLKDHLSGTGCELSMSHTSMGGASPEAVGSSSPQINARGRAVRKACAMAF
eukprot:CAMPEP_0114680388 /NCGR_PEP_ID=MMETSP0191-20121206/54072_1 /TAXON_ID=126664 /ORGANISM="Sorites sp." /LENGTH=105 /DNA_ID=CAMNT_0001957109 /DNA_START=202 /DNA_END=519 /DNA_ORIENTATION=+